MTEPKVVMAANPTNTQPAAELLAIVRSNKTRDALMQALVIYHVKATQEAWLAGFNAGQKTAQKTFGKTRAIEVKPGGTPMA